jgi:RND superfamily putative drug exporter
MTAVFQWGWAASLIGIDRTGPIDAGLPVLAFAVLFGLSMDYEVFLISRMHELWVAHHDNRRAVTQGQSETGRVVTAAAGVMVLVFASFIFGGERAIKLFGLGFSAAVLIDAFVIRTVLIPSLMHIFGRANWWLPRPLERALPRLSVEAGTPVAGTPDGHGTALEDRIPEPAQPG